MMLFDAIGFGALNIDKLFRVNRIAVAEGESFVSDHMEACGGSAANTIVGLARFGCRTGYIGKVADDREGRMLVEDFAKEGVDTNGIVSAKQGRSGSVMGFVGENGERALYVDAGVNDTIKLKEINTEYAFNTRFLHVTSFVGEESFQAQEKLLQTLPKRVKVSLDPGALYARKGLGKLDPIIRRAFVIMPNALELEMLTGSVDYRTGASLLLEKGVTIVAVKRGAEGCYVASNRENCTVEAFKGKVVDTTGAGDAFSAGFLYGLLNSKSLLECGKLGNFVASKCIAKMGARAGLPRIEDLRSLREVAC